MTAGNLKREYLSQKEAQNTKAIIVLIYQNNTHFSTHWYQREISYWNISPLPCPPSLMKWVTVKSLERRLFMKLISYGVTQTSSYMWAHIHTNAHENMNKKAEATLCDEILTLDVSWRSLWTLKHNNSDTHYIRGERLLRSPVNLTMKTLHSDILSQVPALLLHIKYHWHFQLRSCEWWFTKPACINIP